MGYKTHYPTYDVLNAKEDWDPHTRHIVLNRLIRENGYTFLSLEEAEVLRPVCSLLVDDYRGEVIQYILCHIDGTLAQNIGEGQRKTAVPPAQVLVREGVKALNACSMVRYRHHFFGITVEQQRSLFLELSDGRLTPAEPWETVPQKAFFLKLLSLTVESYYSHPKIWSEIGYGGPAYPRGYIRTGMGQLDPWEAKRNR